MFGRDKGYFSVLPRWLEPFLGCLHMPLLTCMVLEDLRAGGGCKLNVTRRRKYVNLDSFILEGLLTIAIAILSFFLLHDFPDTAKFLTVKERAWAVHRLRYQGSIKSGRLIAESERFKWKYVVDALKRLYVCLFMYWGLVCPLYGVSLFLPTIINDLGYKETTAQLLT